MATRAKRTIERMRRRQAVGTQELGRLLDGARRHVSAAVTGAAENPRTAASFRAREATYATVASINDVLREGLNAWLLREAGELALTGHEHAVADLREFGTQDVTGRVLEFDPNRTRRYLEILSPDNAKDLAAVFTEQMTRKQVGDLRQAFLQVERSADLEAKPLRERAKDLRAAWQEKAGDQDPARFIDRAGRRWDNDRYVEMLSRTTSARVERESYIDTVTAGGMDVVRVRAVGDTCPTCLAWDGLLLSVSGNTKDLPTYNQALAAGLYHPNCDCLLEAVIPELESADVERQQAAETPAEITKPKPGATAADRIAALHQYREQIGRTEAAPARPPEYDRLTREIDAEYERLRETSGKGSLPRRQELNREIADLSAQRETISEKYSAVQQRAAERAKETAAAVAAAPASAKPPAIEPAPTPPATPAEPPHAATERSLATGKITRAKQIGGTAETDNINVAVKIRLEDGTEAIWKPATAAECLGMTHKEIRELARDIYADAPDDKQTNLWVRNVIRGTQAIHEVAAWEAAKAFGFERLIPPTVPRTYSGNVKAVSGAERLTNERGTAQAWVPEALPYNSTSGEKRHNVTTQSDARALSVFDMLAASTDRHGGNVLVRKDGSLVGIDHGLSFDVEQLKGHGSPAVQTCLTPQWGRMSDAERNGYAEQIERGTKAIPDIARTAGLDKDETFALRSRAKDLITALRKGNDAVQALWDKNSDEK